MASIELWWLPLGAGGRFVRLNGRVYEALHALRSGDGRSTCTTARSRYASPRGGS